jgi:hypothetical protein
VRPSPDSVSFVVMIITIFFSNYEQLGLKFRLFSAEVLFNKGLSQIYMGRMDEGLRDMEEARRDKATDEHNVIDDAIRDRGEGYTVFSIVSVTGLCIYLFDHDIARRRSISSIREETEECLHQRLHGESGRHGVLVHSPFPELAFLETDRCKRCWRCFHHLYRRHSLKAGYHPFRSVCRKRSRYGFGFGSQ